MRSRPVLAPALLSLALVVGACGGGAAQSTQPTASTEPLDAPSSPAPDTGDATAPPAAGGAQPADVPEFLAFSAPTVDGGQVTGADYAGQDLVLWFWAPW